MRPRSRLRGWPSFAIASAWRRAKRMIKQSTLLWGVAVRVRTILATLRNKPVPTAKEHTKISYLRNSGEISCGRISDTSGQTITSASTISIGISMMPVSLMASRMRMPATAQEIIRQSP